MAAESAAGLRLEGLQLVTMDPDRWSGQGALEMRGGRIAALGPALPPPAPETETLDRTGWIALPGLVQGHVHLCQTLFRGLADDLPLDRWLTQRIWPLEAALDPVSLQAAARLGIAEMLLQGTTTLLDMGTVHDTDVLAETVAAMGIRAIVGKALMDGGAGVPPRLAQSAETAFAEALALQGRWHGAAGGRIQAAFAPRFTLSVSGPLWREIASTADRDQIRIHTHACETPWENETCRGLHGKEPIEMLAEWGVLDGQAILVHAIWIGDPQRKILAEKGTGIVHCPGSNAKLGSGIADVAALLAAGIPVALGSDGAACNDALALALEMRACAQFQALHHGAGRLPAAAPLEMATIGGARAIGMADTIGSLEVGKHADLILFHPDDLPWAPGVPLHRQVTTAAAGLRPREVYVAGRRLVADGRLVEADLQEIRAEATDRRRRLEAQVTD